jgi:survival-of-motor-neuron-related-splicing factor 30
MLEAKPEDEEYIVLKNDLITLLELQNETLAALRLKATTSPAPGNSSQPPPAPDAPKWSVEAHPKYLDGTLRSAQSSTQSEQTAAVHEYHVKDKVLALWKRQFYPATIYEVLGSKSNPKYYVKYDEHSEYATLDRNEIKPIEGRKRKAEAISIAPPVPISNPSGRVISAAANINPVLADQAKREPSKVSDGPVRPKKMAKQLGQSKALEKAKNSWAAFNTSGKGAKAAKKESMFRTPEGINARGKYQQLFAIRQTDRC